MSSTKIKGGAGSGLHRLAANKAKAAPVRAEDKGGDLPRAAPSKRGMDYGTKVEQTPMRDDAFASSLGRKRGGKAGGNWIQGAIKHPGALHKALHVPAGEKIPAKKLAKAAHSSNPTMRRRAALAKTLKKLH
jgi:hypothetical protein